MGKPGSGWITSSPFSRIEDIATKIAVFPEGVTAILFSETDIFFVSFNPWAILLRSGMIPSGALYLVSPFLRALIAADVIFWGVGKSGWPISKWIIFFPSVSSLVALFKTA